MNNRTLRRIIGIGYAMTIASTLVALSHIKAHGAEVKTKSIVSQEARHKAEVEFLRSRTVKVCAMFQSGELKCGTGFYNRRNSFVTQYHVISPLVEGPLVVDPSRILVLTYGSNEFVDAVLVSSEPAHDFAVLRVPTPGPAATLWTHFRLGDKVTVIGNPAGRDFESATVSVSGIVPVKLSDGTLLNMIALNNTGLWLRPGYSGGGVYADGENLIGTLEMCNDDQATCLAIPASDIESQIERNK